MPAQVGGHGPRVAQRVPRRLQSVAVEEEGEDGGFLAYCDINIILPIALPWFSRFSSMNHWEVGMT